MRSRVVADICDFTVTLS